MAEKVLAQSTPAVTTLTDVYTVPASTIAVISTLVICNRSAVATTFRISIAVAGAADDVKQYIFYDIPIAGNDSFVASLGVALAATDKVRAYIGAATLSITLFGVEVP